MARRLKVAVLAGNVALARGLTPEEDSELRSLDLLSEIGTLSPAKQERMVALRLLDRRERIRFPVEFSHDQRRWGA